VREETGRGKYRFKIRNLLADMRCSRAVLDFLSNTDVGRRGPNPVAEEDAQSEESEWELRERREREVERRVEAEELGAGDEEQTLFLPTLSLWRLQKRSRSRGRFSGCLCVCFSFLSLLSFVIFLCDFLGALHYLLGTGLGGGQRG
jgi:hypothetical protein